MYNCKDFIRNIEKYIDKELTKQEVHAYNEHLENCKSCREELTFSISVRDALKRMELPNSPADFLDRVNAAIDSLPEEKPVRKMSAWRTYQAIAACFVLVVALGLGNEILTKKAISPEGGRLNNYSKSFDDVEKKQPEDVDGEKSKNQDKQEQEKSNEINANIPKNDTKSTPEPKAPSQDGNKKGADVPTTSVNPTRETFGGSDTKENGNEKLSAVEKAEPSPAEATISPKEISQDKDMTKTEEKASLEAVEGNGDYTALRSSAPSLAKESPNKSKDKEIDVAFDGISAFMFTETDSICVSKRDIQEVENLAAEYGNRQDNFFEMTEDEFKKFLNSLEEREIDYTSTVVMSGTVKFEIILEE